MRELLIKIELIVLFIGIMALSTLYSPPFTFSSDSSKSNLSKKSLEYKLATLNAGTFISENDPTVATFRGLLTSLSGKYEENTQQIADLSVTTSQMLLDKGIKRSLLEIMTGMDSLTVQKTVGLKYSECIATYITLTTAQHLTHERVVAQLRSILNTLIK